MELLIQDSLMLLRVDHCEWDLHLIKNLHQFILEKSIQFNQHHPGETIGND
jgi:hypothetical protein